MAAKTTLPGKRDPAATRAAERALRRVELEAIRRANDLARLQKKRAELVRQFRGYRRDRGAPTPAAVVLKRRILVLDHAIAAANRLAARAAATAASLGRRA